MAQKIQLRRGTAAQWTAANPILGQGELAMEIDTLKFKIGDGTTTWTSLSYFTQGVAGPTGPAGAAGATWYQGATIPSSGLGVNGDFYFRTVTCDIYNKSSGTWSIIANTIGATGPQGIQGASGSIPTAAAGGSADAITVTYNPPITLADQQNIRFVAAYANATTTPTINPNGLGAEVITKQGGQALSTADIPRAGAVCDLQYNLANTRWELLNPASPSVSSELIINLKLVVNGSVNKLDIFTKSGGAVPDGTNFPTISIPDGTGLVQRTRKATYLSGTSQFIMADAANYWSKGSLDAEIKTAYVYAIWDAAGGIVWALGGYSGFTRCPASTTATDDDFFLLEASSTYTKVITDYCVCVGKIRYQYDTADTPDHTIQATVLDAPQVMWNPKSTYGKTVSLATSITSGADITASSIISAVIKQSGAYNIGFYVSGGSDGAGFCFLYPLIKTGSATFGSAVTQAASTFQIATGYYFGGCVSIVGLYLNAGDTIHFGCAVTAASGLRQILGDNQYLKATNISFTRTD
jgi:hypothetical protein